MTWARLTTTLLLRALVRPALAADLLRVAWRFRARGWWRRPPFLPLPARDYIRWRMYTAYGQYDAIPPADDVVRYARWAGK
jgi:type II secretory pathway predicted ATPase ExeA